MIFLALSQTHSTKHLTLSLMEDPEWATVPGLCWNWVGYGLFSTRARTHSVIDSLFLDDIPYLRTSDMEMFAAVVTSENPEEVVFETPRGCVEARVATLKPSSLIHWQVSGCGDAPSPNLTLDDSIPLIWTFSDDGESEWVNAVVPGYGRCLVQRCNLTFTYSTAMNERPKGVRSLKLSFDYGSRVDRSALSLFLSAVEPTLRILTIHNAPVRFDYDIILHACPRLEQLVLYGKCVDVRFDFTEYHKCNRRLPTLNNSWDGIDSSLTSFIDPSCSLARCVRKLRIFLYSTTDNVQRVRPQADLDELLEILGTNHKLQYLEVIALSEHRRYLKKFRKFHLKPIAVQERPLSRECKAAFLSILSPSSAAKTKRPKFGEVSPLASVDPRFVSSIIFDFAAYPVCRRVFFRSDCADMDRRDLANI